MVHTWSVEDNLIFLRMSDSNARPFVVIRLGFIFMPLAKEVATVGEFAPREVMIALLLGSIFGTGFYQYYSRHGVQVKKTHSKRKCRLFATIFNASCGTLMVENHASFVRIMRLRRRTRR